MKSKTIMTLADGSKRLASPLFGRTVETPLWFPEGEDKALILNPGVDRYRSFRAFVSKCVRDQFGQRRLQ